MRLLRRGPVRTAAHRRMRTAALVVAATLAAAGCSPQDETTEDPLEPPPGSIRLYGVDGNMSNSMGALVEDHPDALAGMKGTAPSTRLSETFRDRLRSIDGGLNGDLYAGETYDAVVISALAAQVARTNDPKDIAAQINGVTTGGTECSTPATCLDLIADGRDIYYRGVSLKLGGFTAAGEPSASTYGIFRFTEENTLASNLTEYVPAGDPGAATRERPPSPRPPAGGALTIGTLLPKSGQLQGAGPPMFAAARLAINEINAAGGVHGLPVQYLEEDDGTDPEVADAGARRLINQGVHVIVGASGSGLSKAILPTVLDAGVILFSPSNTAAELSTIEDNGLYFRTAPPDGLQAKALTDVIMRDGVRRIYMIARDDAYGRPFMESIEENLIAAGLSPDDIKTTLYGTEGELDFTNLGADVKEFAPAGVVVIGYEESADAITSIIEAGMTSRTN